MWLQDFYILLIHSWCPQGSSSSSRRRNTKCPVPTGPGDTGSSSTPWSTTLPWWAPGNTSSIRRGRAFWTEASTRGTRRGAKKKLQPQRRRHLPANKCERDPDEGYLLWLWENSTGLFVWKYIRKVHFRSNNCTYSWLQRVVWRSVSEVSCESAGLQPLLCRFPSIGLLLWVQLPFPWCLNLMFSEMLFHKLNQKLQLPRMHNRIPLKRVMMT